MKKYVAFFSIIIFFTACGGNNNNANTSSASTDSASTTATTNDVSSNPDYQKGLALVAKSNCLTCHKIDEKVIGPAYKDVANKYAGNDTAVTYLAHKVIAGGKGVWGDVMMTPHPDLSEADAEQMVKYILLLKTN